MEDMKIIKILLIVAVSMLLITNAYLEEIKNYSREMQQAITLYREGKNSDAMDRFMDILVNGTPQEKALANEYISRITQGIGPEKENKPDKTVKTISTDSVQYPNIMESKSESEIKSNNIALNVSKKIEDIKNSVLYSLYRKNFIKIYMDESNKKPNYILLKQDRIFNENMTFNEKVIEDINQLCGLITLLGRVVITVIPNGAISGNMKISDIRKANVLYSFFTSFGISPAKIKLDVIGTNISVSKQVDDTNGILLSFDYSSDVQLSLSQDKPSVSLSVYPNRINPFKDEASVVEFAVANGKYPLSSWKLLFNKREKDQKVIFQRIEGTEPVLNQIFFNGREKTVGSYYPVGEYEFYIEASDVKGNNAAISKTFYILGESTPSKYSVTQKELPKTSVKPLSKTVSNNKSLKKNRENSLWKIYFEKNSFNITQKSKESIEQLVEEYKKYKKNPKLKIYITGYASSKEKDNKKVSYKRANAVKNYLVKQYKVNPKRIVIATKIVNLNKRIIEAILK
jgi:outer membrane protein OmpA-like peptidoglycan-associated protein